MNCEQNSVPEQDKAASPSNKIMIQGVVVRLMFSKDDNQEIPGIVRNLLRKSYLRQQVCT